MSLAALVLAAGMVQNADTAARPKLKPPPASAPAQSGQEPAEEDAEIAPKEYAFNPVQAEKEIRTGDFYWKRGKYRAAAARYLEATRWNKQSAVAFRKLGDAEEKQEEPQKARDAYKQALDLANDPKEAAEIRKHLQRLQ